MNILVIEDEKRLADALCQIMKDEKYLCDAVYDGSDGYIYASTVSYDAIVLDVMLPGMNGYELVKKLRENRISTPVIILTAKDETADKINGLDCGADDYMTKPFSPEELLARLRALTRRKGEVLLTTVEFGDLSLDISRRELCVNERSVALCNKEFEIMKILMNNPDTLISKDTLIEKVWGYDSEAIDNNVEAYMSFLRKKFSFLKSSVAISSVRKVGYRLTESEKKQ